MTPQRLAEIKARHKALNSEKTGAWSAFVIHARQDIPDLLAYVREIEKELADAREALKLFGNLEHEKCP